jgi:ATP-dependent helicase/nuclease subunit A
MLGETEDEYRRLLYVAMTRAADRLVVGGCMPGNMNNVRPLCWYDLIGKGLEKSGLQSQTIETSGVSVKRYMRPEDGAMATGQPATTEAAPVDRPAWLYETIATAAGAGNLLRPSDSADGNTRRFRAGDSSQTRAQALRRGTLVHRLLQSLPEIAADRRRDAALNFLRRNAGDWNDNERETLATKVLELISDLRFAAVFGDGSRAEVPIVGRLERPGGAAVLVSGQIDRLVVTEDEVLVVDFKTNQSPPDSAAEAPAAYIRQLALYRAILARLYPQRTIRTALLWTEAPELMEISAPALDAGLTSITDRTSKLDPATTRS